MASRDSIAAWLTNQILVVRNLYTPQECSSLLAVAAEIGFRPASVRTHSGPRMRPDIRDNERALLEDPAVAGEMWRRISEHLPAIDEAEPCGVDSSLRFYKYSGSQRFRRHKDGVATRGDGAASKLSYLLYLNDDYEGGETIFTFITSGPGGRDSETLEVVPETGMALLFIHDQWHEGAAVRSGAKYVLRSDVFYCPIAASDGYAEATR